MRELTEVEIGSVSGGILAADAGTAAGTAVGSAIRQAWDAIKLYAWNK